MIKEMFKKLFNIYRKPNVSIVHKKKNEFAAKMLMIEHETRKLSKQAKEAKIESREATVRAESVAARIYRVIEHTKAHGYN